MGRSVTSRCTPSRQRRVNGPNGGRCNDVQRRFVRVTSSRANDLPMPEHAPVMRTVLSVRRMVPGLASIERARWRARQGLTMVRPMR